jgi:hypothetical protein
VFGVLSGWITGAQAQEKNRPNLHEKIIRYLAFEQLPSQIQADVISAINDYDNGLEIASIATLKKILTGRPFYRPGRSLRAWSYQWLAMNYFAKYKQDSLSVTEKYVDSSLANDLEIWREFADVRIEEGLRRIYQDHWDGIFQRHEQRRKSLRFGFGTISRADYSYRYGVIDFVVGIGTPVVVVVQDEFKLEFFNQFLFYLRIQRMRKNLERLTPGIFVEFALLEEEFDAVEIPEGKLKFDPVLSAGPILSYTYKSGWEIGAEFEIIRLNLSETKGNLRFSQTAFKENFTLSFSNFALYLRKWF